MEKIEKYVLPEYMNVLFKDEAHSFLSLTVDCANKINELIDAFNMFNNTDELDKLNQNGKIAGAIRYMKDNLQSSLKELTDTLIDTGYFENKIEEHCKSCVKCNGTSEPETPEDETTEDKTSTMKSPYLIRKDEGSTLYIYRLCNKGYIRYTLSFELVTELIYLSAIDLCDSDMNIIHTLSKSDNALDGYVELTNGVRFGGVHGGDFGDSGMNYYIIIDGTYYSLRGSFNAIPDTECNYIMLNIDTWLEGGGEAIASRVKTIYFKSDGCLEIANQFTPYSTMIAKLSSGCVSLPKELINYYTCDDDIALYGVSSYLKGEKLNSLNDKSILYIGNDFTLNHSSTSSNYKRSAIINADDTHVISEFADRDTSEISIDTPHTIRCVIDFDY